jgi:hypothetical protein
MISYAVFQVSQTVGAVVSPDFFVLFGWGLGLQDHFAA